MNTTYVTSIVPSIWYGIIVEMNIDSELIHF